MNPDQPKQTTTVIENPTADEFLSDLLRTAAELAETHHGVIAERTTTRVTGKKGEILTAIIVGLATSAMYDLLKEALIRLAKHPGNQGIIELRINGVNKTLS